VSLGDGIIDGASYLVAGGCFGIGTDSNIQIDTAAELRRLEYEQRLARRVCNVVKVQEASRQVGGWIPNLPEGYKPCSGRWVLSPPVCARTSCCSTRSIQTLHRVTAMNDSMPGFLLSVDEP